MDRCAENAPIVGFISCTIRPRADCGASAHNLWRGPPGRAATSSPAATATSEPANTPAPTPAVSPAVTPPTTGTMVPSATARSPGPTPTAASATPTPVQPPALQPTPLATPLPSPEQLADDRLSSLISWYKDPPDRRHSEIAGMLRETWLTDSLLGDSIASLPWMQDGLDHPRETAPLTALLRIAAIDPELLEPLIGQAWIVDGVEGDYSTVLSAFRGLALEDPGLAGLLAAAPWFQDGLSSMEHRVFDVIVLSGNPELGRQMLDFQGTACFAQNRPRSSSFMCNLRSAHNRSAALSRLPHIGKPQVPLLAEPSWHLTSAAMVPIGQDSDS